MYMIIEHTLLKPNFKVKISKRSNPTTTRFFFLGLIDVQCEMLFDLRTWLKISDNP